MTLFNQRNIEAIYQLATLTEQQDGVTWYPKAKAIAKELSTRYDLPLTTCVGVIAALSPRNRWERNIQDADSVISNYIAGGIDQAMQAKVCTFTNNKKKAIQILAESTDDQENLIGVMNILSGPKLREFASCILGMSDVCIDGHAYCIWAGERTGLKDVPSIGVKLRKQIKEDYIESADRLGLTPAALQAITWVTWRRIHGVTK